MSAVARSYLQFAGNEVIPDRTSITDLSPTAQATVAEAATSAPSKRGNAPPKHGLYQNGENTNANISTVAHIATTR